MSKIIIFSEGPPPLGETIAEGGSLRAWGLAKGLGAHGHAVTFAYRSNYVLGAHSKKEIPSNVEIDTWDGDCIDRLLENHPIVIMRYAMGEAMQIAKRLTKNHILVSDSYIPISVEVSARNSDDPQEQENYLRLQKSSMFTTKRADYLLFASSQQELYYLGYLSGINKLNPVTYGQLDKRMFRIPYGIDATESPEKTVHPKDPTILWYGAFYSWFDMGSLIDNLAVLKTKFPKMKLIVAGAKNPYNKDPGLLAHYEKTMKSLEKLGSMVEYIDWHPYKERMEVYGKASVIITQNHIGLENKLAWRTRLMDYVLAKKPIITNGGDPLGEILISKQVAYRATETNFVEVVTKILENPPSAKQFNAVIEEFDWRNITKSLSKELEDASRMKNGSMELKYHLSDVPKKLTKRARAYGKYVFSHSPADTAKKIIVKIKG